MPELTPAAVKYSNAVGPNAEREEEEDPVQSVPTMQSRTPPRRGVTEPSAVEMT